MHGECSNRCGVDTFSSGSVTLDLPEEAFLGQACMSCTEVNPMAEDSHAYMVWLLGLSDVLHAGIGSIRCKWGSVQEATALWELMHAMPEGALEEVGLCRVDPLVLREGYGFAHGALPPMGASPDGLIRQRRPTSASAVQPCHAQYLDAQQLES